MTKAGSFGSCGRLISAAGVCLVAACMGFGAIAAEAPPKPITPAWQDPLFTEPFIDIDEWRDKPVRHRYIHGGFKGTDTLFSIYMPPKEQYQGRFFQPVAATSGDENAAQAQAQANNLVTNENTTIGFAIASGGYLLESNLGARNMYDNAALTMHRASAAVAQHSRKIAAEMYGPHRPYGYTYGGSGGGYKTISAAENTSGIWDGLVPYVIGSPVSIPNMFSVQAHAVRVLKDRWRDVVDANDPGGSGNMYSTLNQEEREALQEVTRMGLPPRTWFMYDRLGYGPFAVLIDQIVGGDPKYFEDFWKVPGYLGANPPESLKKARIQHKTTITKIIMSDEAAKMGLLLPMASRGPNVIPAAFEFKEMPQNRDLKGATIFLQSGGAAGKNVSASAVAGSLVTIGVPRQTFPVVNAIKVGDEVLIDNSIYLAAQTYHRHRIPDAQYKGWDQFRNADGTPKYPQTSRPPLGRGGQGQTGQFPMKMIVVETLMDEYAYPWQADWYRTEVQKALGTKTDDQFRLWYVDNAIHGSATGQSGPDRLRIISYATHLQQALRDVSAWAEKGTPPPATSAYKMVDNQVEIPAKAAERRGVQPVVTLTVNGGARADAKVGQPVTFVGTVEVPPKTGQVVKASWDFEGRADFPVAGEVKHTDKSGERATVTTTYTFSKPGTYFPVLHIGSQRQPDGTPYARLENLARVRVVVK